MREEEEKELFVFTIIFSLKTYSLRRVTVVREGMSGCNEGKIEITLQRDVTRTIECTTVLLFRSKGCEFG